LNLYRTASLDRGINCVSCHTLRLGIGTDYFFTPPFNISELPPGPNGELKHALVTVDGSTKCEHQIPQCATCIKRSLRTDGRIPNQAGFGFLHDGSIDSLARFVSEPVFNPTSDQQVRRPGGVFYSPFRIGSADGLSEQRPELPAPSSKDTHAAVGLQLTVTRQTKTTPPSQPAYGRSDAG